MNAMGVAVPLANHLCFFAIVSLEGVLLLVFVCFPSVQQQ